MSQTTIPVGDSKAVKRWSVHLSNDAERDLYWKKFIGEGDSHIIQKMTELESDAGDTITYDLNMRLRGGMTFGDDNLEGKEEALTFYSDQLRIDQARKAVSSGGAMTRKRTLHNLRKIAKDRLAEYYGEWTDDLVTVYLSGDAAFGAVNEDNKVVAAFAGNAITAPDAAHLMYAGAATSKASLVAGDTMKVKDVERISVKPTMMNAIDPDSVKMAPVIIEGGKHFVLVMSPWQAYDMRTETGDLSWSKIQQAAATAEGRNNPIFKGKLGMINNVILHEHTGIRRFADYGAGSNVRAARALLCGRQAGAIAYGTAGQGTRYSWVEESKNYGNDIGVAGGAIMGFKKTTYNGRDFGVIAVDTAAKDPTV
jgi:N4-gp56 family major capsid protein